MRAGVATALTHLALGCGGESGEPEDVGAWDEAAVVCADGEMLKGIDVSYYQGNVDWQAVKGSGRSFAFARVNHGSFMDPEFADNWASMKDAGLVRGAYQYFDPGGSAAGQAKILVDEVGKLGPGDLPAVLDIEETDGVGPAGIASKMKTWMEDVEAGTGKKPIIYTGKYFWESNVGSGAFDGHPLWVANWYVDCPDLPGAWKDWVFWQHSATGSVPGISGDVDLNRFNGSLADLEALAGKVFEAKLVSVDPAPSMAPGERATARLTLKNVGGKAWGTKVALGTTEPRDRASPFVDDSWIDATRPAAMTGKTEPGDEVVVEITLRAPAEPGHYEEHFNLVHEDAGWFSEAPNAGPQDDAIALAIEVVAPASTGGDDGGGEREPEPDVAEDAPRAEEASDVEGAVCQHRPLRAAGKPAWAWAVVALGAATLRRARTLRCRRA